MVENDADVDRSLIMDRKDRHQLVPADEARHPSAPMAGFDEDDDAGDARPRPPTETATIGASLRRVLDPGN